MRACSLILFAAVVACTSNSDSDQALNTSCEQTVDAFCTQFRCDRTLDNAEHDTNLCSPGFPAASFPCSDYVVVTKSETDTSNEYYYLRGELIAIVGRGIPRPPSCTAGPAHVLLPVCSAVPSTTIAACQ